MVWRELCEKLKSSRVDLKFVCYITYERRDQKGLGIPIRLGVRDMNEGVKFWLCDHEGVR